MRTLIWVTFLVLGVLLAGCGVSAEDDPRAFTMPAPTEPPRPQVGGGPLTTTVYLVRHGRLMPVQRSVPDPSPATALAVLEAGPTQREVALGIRTAVTPHSLTDASVDTGARIVTVAATPEFTGVAGDNQLLAVAQLVWTVTESPDTSSVRVTFDGRPVEVPTDDGLRREPVTRSDFDSVAPRLPTEAATPATTPRPPGVPGPPSTRATP